MSKFTATQHNCKVNVLYTSRLMISGTALGVKTPPYIVPCANNKYCWHLIKAVWNSELLGAHNR